MQEKFWAFAINQEYPPPYSVGLTTGSLFFCRIATLNGVQRLVKNTYEYDTNIYLVSSFGKLNDVKTRNTSTYAYI